MNINILLGKVTHYYDKLGVAIVDVQKQPMKVGDTVKITGHDKEFTQEITSLQVEHDQVSAAQPGETVGLKVDQPVKPGDKLFLASA